MDAASTTQIEILTVADAVAREKGIERDTVLDAMEQAIQHAGKRKYGHEHDIRAEIDRRNGEIRLFRYLEVIEEVENPSTQISLTDAHARNPAAQVGDYLSEELPPLDFGRIAAQTAKQVIVQKVREAERAQIVAEYLPRVGELVAGTVKKVTRDAVIVDLGNNAEALLGRESMIPRETFRIGDRLRALLLEVRPDARGPQLILSRTAPGFIMELFRLEVPEIEEGLLEIKSAARDPGIRAKIGLRCELVAADEEEAGAFPVIQRPNCMTPHLGPSDYAQGVHCMTMPPWQGEPAGAFPVASPPAVALIRHRAEPRH